MNYRRIGSLLMDGGRGSSYGAILVPDPDGIIPAGPEFDDGDGDDVVVESREKAIGLAATRPHWLIW